ncbi:uncharacterized protein PV06_08157 [Exophiala oligosperma]|uniref:Uncharacterized protein n=1 Tax=Exophiala oligosperma TaxID=215243 RepID=A0A0D2AHH8_9EURO|nr:uncharacterized protein PV06_08157 [Exophiala oligosperma]KIW39556.1 hypothetical protein PV06_08157 [Exophiala oligosperma]
MLSRNSSEDLPGSSGIFASILGCFSSRTKDDGRKNGERSHGIERELHVHTRRPHLVSPMTLTVFRELDELPSITTGPPPSQLSKWVSNGMTSLRGSLSSQRRGVSTQISRPLQSTAMPATRVQCPGPTPEPLELAIHKGGNRLSDLPRFDRLSFTEDGAIKAPARTMTRTRSECFARLEVSAPALAKAVSMIDRPRPGDMRLDEVSSTVVPTSRPASEHDALHSHPVSTASLPILPPPWSVQVPVEPTRSGPVEAEACGKYHRHPDCRVQRRVSRWLATNHSSSWDTAKSPERRRRRATFYQPSATPRTDAQRGMRCRQRTSTESTVVSTAGTDSSVAFQNTTSTTTVTTMGSPLESGFADGANQAIRPTDKDPLGNSPSSAEAVDGVVDAVTVDEHGEAARGSDVGVAF